MVLERFYTVKEQRKEGKSLDANVHQKLCRTACHRRQHAPFPCCWEHSRLAQGALPGRFSTVSKSVCLLPPVERGIGTFDLSYGTFTELRTIFIISLNFRVIDGFGFVLIC